DEPVSWTAALVSGGDWLSVSPESAVGDGTITVSYSANTSGGARAGKIRVSAPGATGSPADVTVSQKKKPVCGAGAKRVKTKLAERIVPADATLSLTGTAAVRLTADAPVDGARIWAVLEAGDVRQEGGRWRPVDPEDGRDGWVVFTPSAPLPLGAEATLTVGGVTVAGAALGPVSKRFRVAERQAEVPVAGPAWTRDADDVCPLPSLLAVPGSAVYRIGPAGVFDTPVTVRIPVSAAWHANELTAYYYSESPRNAGWYRGRD
ncbi:unnamed protein product, partial [marine sediment metagenome]